MLTSYIIELKNKFLLHPVVAQRKGLQSGKWKKNSYNQLSNLIHNELESCLGDEQKRLMGTTLSPRTLYNIFEFKRKIKLPLDRRALNTLNKLVLFVGFKNWDEFTLDIDSQKTNGGKSKVKTEETLKHLILKAKQAEFLTYHSLPDVDLSILKSYYNGKGSAYKEIKSNIKTLQESSLIISNPYNPSSIEVIDMSVKKSSVEDGAYVVNTEEYWLLCWYDLDQKKFVKRQRRIEKHRYLVKKNTSEEWKIHTNASSNGVL